MKSRGGAEEKRREEQKREDQRRERVRRKKMQVRKAVGKSRNTLFFPMICGSRGSKSRLAKAAGAEPAGQMSDEKLHAVVHFQVKLHKNTSAPDHFWKLRCLKSARRCCAKHISKSKCTKHTSSGPLLEVATSKKCTLLWCKAHFEVKMSKTPAPDHFWKLRRRKSARCCGAKHMSKSKCQKHQGFGPLLDVQMSFRVAGARDCGPCQKWAKCGGLVAFPKSMAGVGHLKRICKNAFSLAGAVHETCSSELSGGPGADFLRGVAFWSDLASLFPGRRSTLDRWSGKKRKTRRYEAVSSALNFPFLKEVSPNCFVFDVVNLKKWVSLAELLRFWCCQVQKLKKSRWIAVFLMLSNSKTEDVSQNSFVFKLADR